MTFHGTRSLRACATFCVVVASLIGVVALEPSAHAADAPNTLAFGAFAQPVDGQTPQQAVTALETQIGRTLDVVRVFRQWGDQFPDSYDRFLDAGGRTILLSIKPVRSNGTKVTWPSIATAAPGSQVDTDMRSWARRVRDFGSPITVTLHHEPEASTAYGTAADFIAAWRHWVDVFREEGATNARFMWIMTDYSYQVSPSDRRYAPNWYPGDAWVDAMAIDAYNWHVCRPNQDNVWKSLAQIIEDFRRFGLLHPTKQLWLTEWASWEDPASLDRKAHWIDDARALFAQPEYQQFAGIAYFHSDAINPAYGNCIWRVSTSASSLASFAAMANDPLYAGHALGGPTTPSTPSIPSTPSAPVFRAAAAANTSGTAASIVLPSSVVAGDRLLLVVTANTATTATTPTGWTLLGTQTDGSPDMRSWIFTSTATAGSADSTIVSTLGTSSKSSRIVLAYSGTELPTVASVVADAATTTHMTASATVPSNSTVVSYWSDKTNDNTAWTLPGQVSARSMSAGTSSGRITAVAGDTAATGSAWSGVAASAMTASAKAIGWTIVLPPLAPAADPVPTVDAPISFVGQASADANSTTHRVVVPSAVQAGDGLVMAFTSSTLVTVDAPTGVTGWHLVGVQTAGTVSTWIWSRVAVATDAGATVTVATSALTKADLVVSAYRGTSTVEPVASFAASSESVSRAAHTTPVVTVSDGRAWVVWYWTHKDSTTTALTPPSDVTVRSNSTQTGSGRVVGMLADSNGAATPGTVAGRAATAATAGVSATMWTIVLAPA